MRSPAHPLAKHTHRDEAHSCEPRSALPLAAGLTGTAGGLASDLPTLGPNGQLPPLTHEQLSSAAAQLAQVVQSNWGQLGLGPLPVPPAPATISLGSFPVAMPTREQMHAAMAGADEQHEDEEEVFDLTDEDDVGLATQPKSKKKKNKKKKSPLELVPPPPPPPPQPSAYQQPTVAPKAGPSSERERIRDFWLGLRENERRALVKVEKEAVLRKMKEQQRSGCSCAVCGRKRCPFAFPLLGLCRTSQTDARPAHRSAIEEELEVLYDAYYDELESYANHQVRYASSGGTIAPPPGPGPFPGSVDASTAPSPSAPAVPPASGGGKRVVRTTRNHKNVRPAAKKKNPAAPPPPPPAPAAPPAKDHHHHGHAHSHHHGPAHGEPGHTHSTSCPHHPHNHGNGKAKGGSTGKDVEEYDEDEDEDEYESEEDDEGEDDPEGEYDEEEDPSDEADVRFALLLAQGRALIW